MQHRARQKIILDCDPGQDDALALLLALASPEEIEVLAVTTVAGNVPLAADHAATRARSWSSPAGPRCRSMSAARGRSCARSRPPSMSTARPASTVPVLPEPTRAAGRRATPSTSSSRPSCASRRAASPCARSGRSPTWRWRSSRQPAIVPRLKRIVLMGGAIELGNVTAAAEFNIYVDPHAARVVFEAGAPIVMLGPRRHPQGAGHRGAPRAIGAIDTPVARACVGLLDFFNRHDRERYAIPGAPLHDPCVDRLADPAGAVRGPRAPGRYRDRGPSYHRAHGGRLVARKAPCPRTRWSSTMSTPTAFSRC